MIITNRKIKFQRPNGDLYDSSLFLCELDDEKISCLKEYMHSKELERYDSLLALKSKNSFLLGRFCAKKAISQASNVKNLPEILIENGIFGQPIVKNSNISNIQTSIAHLDNLGAAISFNESHLMAIDVEKEYDLNENDLRNHFTDGELDLFDGLKISLDLFYLILFSAKECLGKILKTGLTCPLELFEIDTVKKNNKKNNEFVLTYRNFVQYRVLSCLNEGFVYSIIFPKNSKIIYDSSFVEVV